MNITYIIGNGFDINLGLRTGYKDFYEWYVDQPSENDPDVVKNFKNEINSCLNNTTERNWSDLELALGKYSAQVSSDQFPILYMNIASGLKDYLNREYRRFDKSLYDDKKLRACLEDPVSDYFGDARKYILNAFAFSQAADTEINILSFNYTSSLEDLLGKTDGWRKQDGTFVKLKPIAHIHHSLSEGNIVFGVNDEQQIVNTEYAKRPGIYDLFIKPQANNVLGGYTHYAAEYIIRDTNLFVLYGVSLGDTDRKWWNLIGKRLASSEDVRMIWFVHDKPENQEFASFLYKQEECKKIKEFKAKTLLPQESLNNVDKKIYVTLTNKMFNIRRS